MPPAWFGPPNAHAHSHPMRQTQPQQPGGGGRFHPSGQRMPPAGGSSVNGGVNSPHTYHQRSSPPMRGPYPGHGHPAGPRAHAAPPHGVMAHPHGPRMAQGGGGRFQMQHPQGMVVGGPRPMPPNAGGHGHMARHHAPSPGMPRRMPLPPPNAMRPIPQQARPPYDQQRASGMQQHPHGHPGMHHQHMMRMQQEHQQQQQMHHQRQAFHHHQNHPSSGISENHQMHRPANNTGENSENRMQQPPHYQQPPPAPPGTPERRPSSSQDSHSRSPSPPAIPPPPCQQQLQPAEVSLRPSPASLPDSDGSMDNSERNQPPPLAKTPSWNPGPGLGPLRESRLQNMPQKRLMVPMQQHPHHHHHHPHAQRPIPQHPNTNAYINENMERFRAMELKHGGPHMKPIHHHQPMPHQQPPQILHPNARPMVASPSQKPPAHQKVPQQGSTKKGPDITMDAASMLLALRTSASPSTVSAATLEEQASRDQSESFKKTASSDHQDHDDLEDDDVPALASSSSSLSAPPPKPSMQYHEVPKNFPTRLALPNDEAKLNSLHCFLRSELLEIFVVERSANKSPTHSPGSSVGRVGLRCVFCAMSRKRHAISTETSCTQSYPHVDEAPMAVFYPKSIAEIYRLVTSWQRCHLRKCRNLPPDIRSKWQLLRENDKSRGKTHYWITSAKEIGLVDCQSRAGGIRFATQRSSSAASGSIATASGAVDNDTIGDGMHNQSHENDRYGSSYQPHNNPNFLEGPSQKHREAVSRDVSSTPLSTVESPLKSDHSEAPPAKTSVGISEESSSNLLLQVKSEDISPAAESNEAPTVTDRNGITTVSV